MSAGLGGAAVRRTRAVSDSSSLLQLLSNTLYYKRFFPYYAFNICAGLDEQGTQGAAAVVAPRLPTTMRH